MQNFKAGLSKALTSREDSLRAGAAPCPLLADMGPGRSAYGAHWQPHMSVIDVIARKCAVPWTRMSKLCCLSVSADPCACIWCAEVAAKAATVDEGSGTVSATALQELNKDSFWAFLKEADEAGKLVVVDFYTDW